LSVCCFGCWLFVSLSVWWLRGCLSLFVVARLLMLWFYLFFENYYTSQTEPFANNVAISSHVFAQYQ
jgi:hypothetical protein